MARQGRLLSRPPDSQRRCACEYCTSYDDDGGRAQRRTVAPFLDSSALLGAPEHLRKRALQDGYPFVRDLVSHNSILRLRRDVTRILDDVRWLDDGTAPMDAISTIDAKLMGTPEFNPIYETIQRLESFHTMAHDREILDIAEILLGEPAMPQPSTIARVMFASGVAHTTPPHQDFVLVQGTPEVWTCWIPLGACPRSMGVLAVLRGSHERGVLPTVVAAGAGGLRVEDAALGRDWLSNPFDLGDALFFHSKTVHQGVANVSGNRIRLSVDYRYQRKTDLIMERNLGVHQGRLTWEQVYEDWESEEYQYYWQLGLIGLAFAAGRADEHHGRALRAERHHLRNQCGHTRCIRARVRPRRRRSVHPPAPPDHLVVPCCAQVQGSPPPGGLLAGCRTRLNWSRARAYDSFIWRNHVSNWSPSWLATAWPCRFPVSSWRCCHQAKPWFRLLRAVPPSWPTIRCDWSIGSPSAASPKRWWRW